MLRILFVLMLTIIGACFAATGAFGGLLFYIWVAYFRPEEWVWKLGAFDNLNLSLISGVYLLLRAPWSDAKFRFDWRSSLVLAFLAFSLASTLTSVHAEYSWPFFTTFAKAAVVTYLITALTTDVARLHIVMLVMAVSLGFEGAKAGWILMVFNPGSRNNNELPMLGDNNGVAVGMLMLVALFIGLSQTARGGWERWIHRFFAVGVAYRAISTYSRGGFLAAGAMILVYVLRSKQKVRAFFATALVAGLVLSVLPQNFWDRMSTIHIQEEELEDDSARSRLHFWRVAVEMADANPILGVGFNAFNKAYNDYDFSRGRYGVNRSVHSSWFAVLAELGYPGFLLYITILLMSLYSCEWVISKARRGHIPVEYRYYAVAIETGFGAFIVGGSFLPWQYTEMLWHFFALSIALRSIAFNAMKAAPVSETVEAPARPPFQPLPALPGV